MLVWCGSRNCSWLQTRWRVLGVHWKVQFWAILFLESAELPVVEVGECWTGDGFCPQGSEFKGVPLSFPTSLTSILWFERPVHWPYSNEALWRAIMVGVIEERCCFHLDSGLKESSREWESGEAAKAEWCSVKEEHGLSVSYRRISATASFLP